jgi:hypothetical protein
MSQGLENLYESLTGAEVEADKPEQQQEPEQTEEVKDEGVKEESAPPAESQAPAKDERFIPINALLDEREKRQRLEAELAQMKAQAEPAKEDTTEDDLFSNPAEVLRRVQMEAYAAARRDMINMSEAILFESKPDAQEKIDAFKDAVQQNPTLYQQMLQHPNPAGFAYQEGSKFLSVKSMPNDMAAYEKELRAKIEAELAAKYGQKGGKLPSSIPTTLSDVPNVKPEADEAPDALDIGAILKAARR